MDLVYKFDPTTSVFLIGPLFSYMPPHHETARSGVLLALEKRDRLAKRAAHLEFGLVLVVASHSARSRRLFNHT